MSKAQISSWVMEHNGEQYDVMDRSLGLGDQDRDWRITNEDGWEYSGDVSDPWVTNGRSYPSDVEAFKDLDNFFENRPINNILDNLNNLEVQVADLKTELMTLLNGPS